MDVDPAVVAAPRAGHAQKSPPALSTASRTGTRVFGSRPPYMTIKNVSDGGGCANTGARKRLLNSTGSVVPAGISPNIANGDCSDASSKTGVPYGSCRWRATPGPHAAGGR